MKYLLLAGTLSVYVLVGSCFASEQSLIYKHYNDKTGTITKKDYVHIKNLPTGGQAYTIRAVGQDYVANDEFVLDENYMTRTWKRVRDNEDTNYSGKKIEHTLFIKGTFKGKVIDARIDLDDKPFYDDPPFNLTQFVLSDKKHIKFWMMRRDRPAKMQMQAKKREEETLLINGQEMDVIKVACTKSGLREKHFKRFYYFRKSDGLFVKQATSNGLAADLISIK